MVSRTAQGVQDTHLKKQAWNEIILKRSDDQVIKVFNQQIKACEAAIQRLLPEMHAETSTRYMSDIRCERCGAKCTFIVHQKQNSTQLDFVSTNNNDVSHASCEIRQRDHRL